MVFFHVVTAILSFFVWAVIGVIFGGFFTTLFVGVITLRSGELLTGAASSFFPLFGFLYTMFIVPALVFHLVLASKLQQRQQFSLCVLF